MNRNRKAQEGGFLIACLGGLSTPRDEDILLFFISARYSVA